MTDGVTVKEHTVELLAVTHTDADAVYGTASPGAEVLVMIGTQEGWFELTVIADGAGEWTADFTGIVEIGPGVAVEAADELLPSQAQPVCRTGASRIDYRGRFDPLPIAKCDAALVDLCCAVAEA